MDRFHDIPLLLASFFFWILTRDRDLQTIHSPSSVLFEVGSSYSEGRATRIGIFGPGPRTSSSLGVNAHRVEGVSDEKETSVDVGVHGGCDIDALTAASLSTTDVESDEVGLLAPAPRAMSFSRTSTPATSNAFTIGT